MPDTTDQAYLRDHQYRDSSNLDARMALHNRFSLNPQPWQEWVFDQLDLPAEARVLELGCGPGALWRANLERIPPGWEVTLSDFSAGMIAQARASLEDAGHPFAFRVLDAQDIPFPAGHFDAVIANHMLYHVPDLGRTLAEIARVLRPGGRLYAATNGPDHMRDLDDLIIAFAPQVEPALMPGKRLRFRLDTGAALLAPHFPAVELRRYEDGLRVTEVEPLVAYVASMGPLAGNVTPELREAFSAFVAARLAAGGGVITIRKETGLFIATASALQSGGE